MKSTLKVHNPRVIILLLKLSELILKISGEYSSLGTDIVINIIIILHHWIKYTEKLYVALGTKLPLVHAVGSTTALS